DVVVRPDHGAAGANQFHLTGHARDFDAVADCDGPFGQDDETADEIARDILQPEADPDTDRTGENRERAEMNAGVLENDEDADDEDQIADDMRDRVLQGAVQPALDQEAVEKETLCPRGKPEDRDEHPDEEEHLDE